MKDAWPWLMLLLLGAYHGINPAMGWLFAVALGLQERSRAAVVRAFAPLALGHAASIAVVAALVGIMQHVVSPAVLKWSGAGALLSFGLYKLVAPLSCPRWVGMRVRPRELAAWSFLMSTACGAGLMLVPVLLKLPAQTPGLLNASITSQSGQSGSNAIQAGAIKGASHADDAQVCACRKQVGQIAAHRSASAGMVTAAVLLHTLAMFVVMAVIALVVYEKIGLAILRRAWLNLDLLWAGALICAGLIMIAV